MIGRHGPAAAGLDPVPPNTLRVLAPAKVNLFLEVLGKRPDGYHEIATLMMAIDLTDVLDLSPSEDGSLSLTCDEPDLSTGPDNLVLKAALRLRAKTGTMSGATIRLTKRIPWAAGLGGGSSDAAATLKGLNELWKLGLSREELSAIGAELGSDVPFFLNGNAAWCTGRGEIIEPVAIGRPLDLVLVKPPEALATAEVYRHVRMPATPRSGETLRGALAAGDVEAIGRSMHNRCRNRRFR
jgi:4-diphosphocytidyl-2-C-methyl-D-erythritol kinase